MSDRLSAVWASSWPSGTKSTPAQLAHEPSANYCRLKAMCSPVGGAHQFTSIATFSNDSVAICSSRGRSPQRSGSRQDMWLAVVITVACATVGARGGVGGLRPSSRTLLSTAADSCGAKASSTSSSRGSVTTFCSLPPLPLTTLRVSLARVVCDRAGGLHEAERWCGHGRLV